jgi:trehalose-phosphatase
MPPLDKPTVQALARAEGWLEYQQLSAKAEFKTGSIAMHWRGLSEGKVAEVRDRVLLGWRGIAADAGLQLLEFDGGVEIRPALRDKGDAVRTVLAEMSSHTPVACLGDDSTDEPAFRAINGRGLSILVRQEWRDTAAQTWLRPPDELLEFLNQWLKVCQPLLSEDVKDELQKASPDR